MAYMSLMVHSLREMRTVPAIVVVGVSLLGIVFASLRCLMVRIKTNKHSAPRYADRIGAYTGKSKIENSVPQPDSITALVLRIHALYSGYRRGSVVLVVVVDPSCSTSFSFDRFLRATNSVGSLSGLQK